LAEQHVYSDMLQEYMQQQQQGGTAEQKQHPGHYKRPSRRSSSSTAAASGSSDAAQSQQQPQAQNQPQQQLPAYMTRGMLKQYGLWSGQQAGTAAGVPHAQHQQEAAEDDMEYAYDVYVPAEPGSSSGWETPPAAAAAAGSSGVQDPGAAYTAGMDASGLHVIQVGVAWVVFPHCAGLIMRWLTTHRVSLTVCACAGVLPCGLSAAVGG
jgi:hypothetical protein